MAVAGLVGAALYAMTGGAVKSRVNASLRWVCSLYWPLVGVRAPPRHPSRSRVTVLWDKPGVNEPSLGIR
jgi:hypothetical protein